MTSLPRRILIIDQDEIARTRLCEQLSELGFMVEQEDTGQSGLSRITRDAECAPFHGLIVELDMPILGGLAVLREVAERFPDVRVIMMSDAGHIHTLRQAVQSGAAEYLLKPFDPKLLQRKCLSIFKD